MNPIRIAAAAGALALSLTGCGGIDDPYAPGTQTADSAQTTTTETVRPSDDRPPRDDQVVDLELPDALNKRPAPVRTAVEYALAQTTWSSSTWVRQQRRLRALSTGRARREIDAVSADVSPADQAAALAESRATSRGTFVAADLVDVDRRRKTARVIVVAKVIAGGAGRRDSVADWTVSDARLRQAAGNRWRVERFVTLP